MVESMYKLIDSWRNTAFEDAPYLYSEDRPFFTSLLEDKSNHYRSLGDYTSSDHFGDPNDKSLHLGLLPQPYIGNITRASVFILMLNPGLHSGDYFAEENHSQFRQLVLRNIRQENTNDTYPFIFLNPEFAWHPGFEYFHKRFDELAGKIKPKVGSYQNALSLLAQNVACLELLPYHSKSFGSHSLIGKLPSTVAMLEFAREVLLGRAERDDVLVIVTRGVRYWKLPEQKNVILYKRGETRSGYLTAESRKKIMEKLGL